MEITNIRILNRYKKREEERKFKNNIKCLLEFSLGVVAMYLTYVAVYVAYGLTL